jgi:hypothetical protein
MQNAKCRIQNWGQNTGWGATLGADAAWPAMKGSETRHLVSYDLDGRGLLVTLNNG